MNEDDILRGLQAGKTLVVDRRDCPFLDFLLDLERSGEVVSEFVEYDEQSSALKFRWNRNNPSRREAIEATKRKKAGI